MASYKPRRSTEFMETFPKTIGVKVMRKDLRAYNKKKEERKHDEFEFFEKGFANKLNLRKK